MKLHINNSYIEFAILRMGIALTILVKVMAEFSHLDLLYSGRGIVQRFLSDPLEINFVLSLPKLVKWLHIEDERVFLSVLYLVFGFSAVLLLVGYKTKWNVLICLFIHMFIFNGYNLLAFGFDGFLFTLLFYAWIFPVHKVFSVDHYLNSYEAIKEEEGNFYLKILRIHLCIVYFTAGISKVAGQEWIDGTAIWSAVNQPQFYTSFTPIMMPIIAHPYICCLLTWSVLCIEVFFPILIWIKFAKIRSIVLTSIILMHLFIGCVMGLGLFAWVMIVFDMAAFGRWYVCLIRFINGRLLRAVNTVLPAKEISGIAGYGKINQVFTTKQLYSHNRAGQGGIGGACKNCDKA